MRKTVKINFILIVCPEQVFLQECPEPFGLSEFLMVIFVCPNSRLLLLEMSRMLEIWLNPSWKFSA